MAATVITSAADIVRVSHDLTVADDGLVTLKASFYVPRRLEKQARENFQLYQRFQYYREDPPLPPRKTFSADPNYHLINRLLSEKLSLANLISRTGV